MLISSLGAFNAVSFKDWGSKKLATGIAYGRGARQKLDIYGPKGAGREVPIVYFIYGGAWHDGTRRDYDFVGRAFAALGYLTIIPDYRVVPEAEYPAFLDDCAAGFAWTVAHAAGYGGDAERIALAGHSAGAYNAVMLALDPRYLRAQGAMERVRALVGLSGPYDFFPFDVETTLRTFGAVRTPEATQPRYHDLRVLPPVFLATGDRDQVVFPANTIALAKAVRAVGGEVDEKIYSPAGHAMTLLPLGRLLRCRLPLLADIAAFLESHMSAKGTREAMGHGAAQETVADDGI